MKDMRKIKYIRWFVLGILFIAFVTVPVWGSQYILLFCLFYCLYLSISQMWNLLAGYSGLLSLGQQAFIGLGGYTVAVMTNYYGIPLWPSVILGGFFSVLLALLMSLFIFRMKGVYFAIGTLIFSELLLLWFSNWGYVKYGKGMFIKADHNPTLTEIYYIAFIIVVLAILLVLIIMRSGIGLGLMAMRDNEEASEIVGVNIFALKLFCFLVAAFMTGITAGVIYIFQIYIQPYKAFGIDWTVIIAFIVIIGGIGTIEGPIAGTFIYVLLSQWLAEFGHISMLLLGIIAIIIILVAPMGIMGTLQKKFNFEVISLRRR